MSALFTADELAHATGGTMTLPFHAGGVSIDTRTLQPDDLFVALATKTGDGHRHIAEAIAKGAAGALVHDPHDAPDDAKLLLVGDTLAALQSLGAFARERFQGSVVAITGSVGKTTTKEMLRTMLSAAGRTHAAVASYNNHWGVPLTLARTPPEADYAIVEIGMNHPGEIAPLAKLAGPDVAVITAIETAHIGHMHSIEAIADEKAAILDGLLLGGTAVLPADSPYLSRLRARLRDHIRVREFSSAQLTRVEHDADGSTLVVDIDGVGLSLRVPVPGLHMASNALAALHTAAALGVDLRLAAQALGGFGAVAGRGTRAKLLGGAALLLDESYNASPAAMRAALVVLKLQNASRRLAVLGDMLELGAHSEREHAGLADAVSDSADLLYACGPWMRGLYDTLPAKNRGAHAGSSAELAPIVRAALRPGDAVLVKGSLGSRMRVVVDALRAEPG